MHAYVNDLDKMAAYLGEGYHKMAEMPPMPPGNPFDQYLSLLESERRMRGGKTSMQPPCSMTPTGPTYSDCCRHSGRAAENERLEQLARQFVNSELPHLSEIRRTMRRKHRSE